MSNNLNLPSKSVLDALSLLNGNSDLSVTSEAAAQRVAEELLIDAALRNVKLPDGFLTRLGKLAYAMPDDTADQVDWLGC
jgi:hypothetical protein